MTSDELGFLAKICAEPQEDTHRLALADWLDDHPSPDPVTCPQCRGLKPGDVVEPLDDNVFASGSGRYGDAVVVSLNPFAICSREGDMLWTRTQNPAAVDKTGELRKYRRSPAYARWKRDVWGAKNRPDPKCPRCECVGTVPDTFNADRAAFIRVQIETANEDVGECYSCRVLRKRNKTEYERRESRNPCSCTPKYDAFRGAEHSAAKKVYDHFQALLGPVWAGRGKSQHIRCEQHASFKPDRQYILRRGFLDELIIPADVWLAHHERLHWHPTQKVKAPKCDVCRGEKEDERGRWKDKHGHDYWIRCHACKGKEYIPRPCPETAQPITKVAVSELPTSRTLIDQLSQKHWISWPLAEVYPQREGTWSTLLALFRKEWPGITFTREDPGSSTPH